MSASVDRYTMRPLMQVGISPDLPHSIHMHEDRLRTPWIENGYALCVLAHGRRTIREPGVWSSPLPDVGTCQSVVCDRMQVSDSKNGVQLLLNEASKRSRHWRCTCLILLPIVSLGVQGGCQSRRTLRRLKLLKVADGTLQHFWSSWGGFGVCRRRLDW